MSAPMGGFLVPWVQVRRVYLVERHGWRAWLGWLIVRFGAWVYGDSEGVVDHTWTTLDVLASRRQFVRGKTNRLEGDELDEFLGR